LWFGRGLDGPADAEVSKFLSARSPNDYAVTADSRVSRSGRASKFYEVPVADPNAQKQGPDAAYANPSLSRIMIYLAYLEKLIGCVFVRITWLDFHCAKRWCLYRYC